MLVCAQAGTFAILAPVFKGDTCSALPSARAYLIVFAVIQLATVPLLLYTNAMRINKDLNPHITPRHRRDAPLAESSLPAARDVQQLEAHR